MKQSEIIHKTEGDAWWKRNRLAPRDGDRLLAAVSPLIRPQPTGILEIGCGTGWRLHNLRMKYPAMTQCFGIDLSWEAIKEGRAKFSNVFLRVGHADMLGYVDESFDIVILGFFMYLLDRQDLFKVVTEVDRVLKNKGTLVIHDFASADPHARPYTHDSRLLAYKYDYERLFTGNPAYVVKSKTVSGTVMDEPVNADDAVSITVLQKNLGTAWPLKP